ncbi:MAG: sulfatase-like hydrolase/transferase [Anaerolineaceae bacterium]|nr:sulfatase-like hydrolase/transferase [Anaerolineaceae bacterium]
MRLLYIDIDSLRLDHLGCYGYLRNTSPNIDQLAQESVCFTNVYVSDAPCLPSRTALWSGRTGFHNGVVSHGGVAAQPFPPGPNVGDRANVFTVSGWMGALTDLGMKTATVSPFGQRHAAWHWHAGFNEIYNTGQYGDELADDIVPVALDWLERNGRHPDWFLHVNLWDPHTPYRTPASFGHPFAEDPLPDWFTEEMWQRAWNGYGPHSPQEPNWLWGKVNDRFPRQPDAIDSMDAVRQWVDSYDTGIRYADAWLGKLIDRLKALGIYDETIIVVSADHGENLGELNVWGDHQTADHLTCNIPLIIRYPSLTENGRVDTALHYHFDWAATMIELLGGTVPGNWDGISFAAAFRAGKQEGREFLVTSQGAWACQRGVRFVLDDTDYLCLRTYHDGFKELEPIMLFNLNEDHHLQNDLAAEKPGVVAQAMSLLESWTTDQMLTSQTNVDPLMTVLREGGPFYTRGQLPRYIERLNATGRAHHAQHLAQIHPDEV